MWRASAYKKACVLRSDPPALGEGVAEPALPCPEMTESSAILISIAIGAQQHCQTAIRSSCGELKKLAALIVAQQDVRPLLPKEAERRLAFISGG